MLELNDENEIRDPSEAQLTQPVEVAELKATTKEDQAHSQVSGPEIIPEEPEVVPEKEEEKIEWKTLKELDTNRTGGFYPGSNYAFGSLRNTLQGLSAPGLGLADFAMDAFGTLGGPIANQLDTAWDRATRLPNDFHQNARRLSSIVIPSIIGGGLVARGVQSPAIQQLPRLQKALVAAGLFSAEEAAVIGLSDVGEDHNALRALADFFPGVFGPDGWVPIPDAVKTLDSDSTSVRKWKNMLDTAGLSVLGSLLGYFITLKGNRNLMDWFNPLDEQAASYKNNTIINAADRDKLMEIQSLREQLADPNLTEEARVQLIDSVATLENNLSNIDNLEDALRIVEDSKLNEEGIAAERKLNNGQGIDEFDADITPTLGDSANARLRPDPGNVARNMADTTSIKNGVTTGDPAPIITESFRSKGLGDSSRGAVMGVAEEARELGTFDAYVENVRWNVKQMNAAAWDIYTSIIDPGASMDDVKALFMSNRDSTSMLLGRFKLESINEEQARAAAFALRDLTDRFLGRSVTEASARVMDTLGREASTIAESVQKLSPAVDDNRAMDLIIDKMQFLLDELALNKYLSGWKLRNKNWFDQIPPGNLDEAIEGLTEEFKRNEQSFRTKNLNFTAALKELADTNPEARQALVDAFSHTNGDVDSIDKLMKWAADQVTPTGLFKSPNPKQLNLFARGTWGVIYNNVLSGISALKAAVNNTGQLTLKPITAVLGHGIWGPTEGFEGFKRSMYYHGAVYETNKRALLNAWTMTKKAWKDPQVMMNSYRKDFIFQEDQSWDILENMVPVWEKEGNFGRIYQYRTAKLFKDLAKLPGLRYGMTAMVFPDVFAQTHLAHMLGRLQAYDQVFTEFGYADPKKLLVAEKEFAATMFDKNGLVKDSALKAVAGELSLNLDDSLSTWLNQATTAYPVSKHLFMFPRTQSNYVKNALSWTPISVIPGINKYSKTIWAQTDEDIAAALAEHGIDMANTPHAKAIFQHLRAEYTGRIAFSSLLTKTLWDHAMAGNIRGSGHYNASRRAKERDQFGYEPKTIMIGNHWLSFKGLIGVEQALTVLGDLAYYASDIDESLLENWQAKLMWTFASSFLNETPLQGLEPLVSAASGDFNAWNRFIANTGRAYLPLSGAVGVLNNAITSAQKDLNGEINEYIMNRIPFLSNLLADRMDIWTGKPVNDIDNPVLKVLNALSPIKVSGTREPWRVWLESTGWNGMSKLRKSSDGSYVYTPKEREIIYEYMGEQQMYKQLERLMKSNRYNRELGQLRTHRATGADIDNPLIKLNTQKLPVIQEINGIVKRAQKIAELRLQKESEYEGMNVEHIERNIIDQQLTDRQMQQGDVTGARRTQKRNLEQRQLLQMRK